MAGEPIGLDHALLIDRKRTAWFALGDYGEEFRKRLAFSVGERRRRRRFLNRGD